MWCNGSGELERAARAFLGVLGLAQDTGVETIVMWEGVGTIRELLRELAERHGSEKVKELALSALDLERGRFRKALEEVRRSLIEADRLTASAGFGREEASRAVDLLERTFYQVRCVVNGMKPKKLEKGAELHDYRY